MTVVDGKDDLLVERQIVAGSVALALGIGIPVVYLAVMGIVTGWLWIADATFGIDHHIHEHLWGWLTHFERDKNGFKHAYINRVPAYWLFGVLNLWLLYQACELVAWPIRAYRDHVRRNEAT